MKRLILFLLAGIFFICSLSFVSAVLTNTTLLNDTFESGNFNLWTDNGATDWELSTTRAVSPTHSAEASSDDNDLLSDDLDMSDASAIYISFSYWDTGIDDIDNVILYYWDGANYDSIIELGTQTEGQWNTFYARVTDSQYFDNGFHIYIEGSSIDNGEFLWIDNVLILKEKNINYPPNITNITASHTTIKGGNNLTIYANTTSHGVNDTEQGTLYFYCDNTNTPNSTNTDCTGGTTLDTTYPYVFTCTFATAQTNQNYTEFCRVYDGNNYSSTVPNITYTTDSTAPAINFTSPSETSGTTLITRNNILINATASDSGSGLKNITVRLYNSTKALINSTNSTTSPLYINFTSLANGVYFFNATAYDNVGNYNSTETRNVIINYDLTAPSINLTYPLNITYSTNVSSLNYTVSDANLQACWYSLDNGATNITITCGQNVTGLTSTEGSNTWRVYANDSAGNLNSSSITFFKDTIAPEINISSPQEGGTYGYNVSLSLNFSVFDSHQVYCWYNINNGVNITLLNCQNTTFNASADGSYTLYLYANDSLGNIAIKNSTFSVLVGAPTVILTSPIGIYLNTHNITFRYVPSDLDLGSCELWGDFTGAYALNQTDDHPVSDSENVFDLNLPDGTYKWNIGCNDSLGHYVFNGNKTFYVDNVAPSLSISEPQGTKSSWTGIPLNFSASDSSPLSCYYNLTTSTGNLVIGNTLINNCLNTNFNVLTDGDYVVYMKVVDAAANYNFASSSFSIDTATGVTLPSGGGGGCLYNWNCADWSECSQEGKQTRACSNIGTCSNDYNTPERERNCTYLASLAPKKALPTSEKALFDVVLTIINPQIILGEDLTAKISLMNFGNKTNLNVTLNYMITDSNNKTILREKETVPVEIQNEFIKEFVLPSQITLGEYKLFVEIDYEGKEKEATSQGSFEILSEKQGFFSSLTGKAISDVFGKRNYWIIGVSLLMIITIIVYILIKRRKNLIK